MSEYERLYRRAEVRERWANIYGGKTLSAKFMRLWAAEDRLWAEVIKGLRLVEIVAWLDRQLAKTGWFYRWLSW